MNCIVLFDPRLRVSSLLIDLWRRIAEGVVVRRMAHGQLYWDLGESDSVESASPTTEYLTRARKRLRSVAVLS